MKLTIISIFAFISIISASQNLSSNSNESPTKSDDKREKITFRFIEENNDPKPKPSSNRRGLLARSKAVKQKQIDELIEDDEYTIYLHDVNNM